MENGALMETSTTPPSPVLRAMLGRAFDAGLAAAAMSAEARHTARAHVVDQETQALARASAELLETEVEYMCPNCVTPWKCNGPHLLPGQRGEEPPSD